MATQPINEHRQLPSTNHDAPSAMLMLRRLYVYGVAAVTLAIAAIGAVNLLGIGLNGLLKAITGNDWTRVDRIGSENA